MILLIDNYDSFVHNLARYFIRLGHETEVVRNDQLSIADIAQRQPEAVVLSPGPCTPQEAGISLEVVGRFLGQTPILGVCLGHQTIAAALGAQIVRAPAPMHGRTSKITHDGQGIFKGLHNPLQVSRYHSLVVERSTVPDDLEVSSQTPDGVVMSLRHRTAKCVGVQFHPESILTEAGYLMLANFLTDAGLPAQLPAALGERPQPAAPPQTPARPVTF